MCFHALEPLTLLVWRLLVENATLSMFCVQTQDPALAALFSLPPNPSKPL